MQETTQATKARYDDLPYSSYAYMYSAPEQLAAVAALFGMPSPPVENARVLELGCASGGNLIPFALRHPQATALGVDISGVQVAAGREYIRRLGIDNISMLEGDFQAIDPESLGRFDYIVAHGVYSWVSPEAQEAVLRIIRHCLAPEGLAFVSYNTYPGWKAKEILRDAMLMHGGVRPDAGEQVAYGRAMLGFLEKIAIKGGLAAAALNENMMQVMNSPVNYVAHDYLEPFNLPCYFHQMVERAGRHELAYLGEARPSMMLPSNYSQELSNQLYGALGMDQVRVEQYLDFAIGRSFRQTLLIHKQRAADLRWQVERETLHRMHYAANLACADGPIKLDGLPQEFVLQPSGARISAGLSGLKQAMDLLGRTWPGTVTRDELMHHAASTQGDKDVVSREVLADAVDEMLEKLVLRGMAQFRLAPVVAASSADDLMVDPLVQRQVAALAPEQDHVANAWHDTVGIGTLERLLMPMMAESVDRDALVARTADALRDGLLPADGGKPPAQPGDAPALVDAMLQRLRDAAVFQVKT